MRVDSPKTNLSNPMGNGRDYWGTDVTRLAINSLLAAGILSAISSAAIAEDDPYFLVTAAGLSCVASHAETYDLTGGDTVFVSMENCNTESGGQISLFDQVQNSAPDINVSQEEGADDIVALNSNDLECVAKLALPTDGALYAFYPNECRLVEK